MVDKYGAILDAGSSGTRIHIYKWKDHSGDADTLSAADLKKLPEIKTKKKWTKKTKPGVSTYHDKPHDVGPEHLAPLFEHALDVIPKHAVAETPLFLLATAGMRLLPDDERQALLDEICTYARRNTQFLLPDCGLHIQVISGETEGLYGWIATNYLLGGFDQPTAHDHGKGGHHTYGFLDMGGASAQIAFAPNATEAEKHPDDLLRLRMRRLDGERLEYKVFVTTWLGYGVNEARRRYVEQLVDMSGDSSTLEIPDPCLPKGLKEGLDGSEYTGTGMHLLGTGLFEECERTTFPLLAEDIARPCSEAPCLLKGHIPAIDFDVNHFVGVSEFWHTTHDDVFADGSTSSHPVAYDFATYQQRVKEFCSLDWSTISSDVSNKKWGKKVDEDTAAHVCFKASWVINVLHDGIGIPRVGIEPTPKDGHNGTQEVLDAARAKGFLNSFQAVDKIDDVEVSWTLGKMVLYAASQIAPPARTGMVALPVGFGPNVGWENKWTYASSASISEVDSKPPVPLVPMPGNNYSVDTEEPHWHDSIWREGDRAPRRIPGMILFLLIFLLATFLLLGRERRGRLYRSINPQRTRLGRKILGGVGVGSSSGSIMYERVMEEGSESVGNITPPEFELTEVDEEDGGWTRNKLHHPSAGKGALYDPFLPPSADTSAIRPSGLGERTGSRERMSASRGVSPNRQHGAGMRRERSYGERLSPSLSREHLRM